MPLLSEEVDKKNRCTEYMNDMINKCDLIEKLLSTVLHNYRRQMGLKSTSRIDPDKP